MAQQRCVRSARKRERPGDRCGGRQRGHYGHGRPEDGQRAGDGVGSGEAGPGRPVHGHGRRGLEEQHELAQRRARPEVAWGINCYRGRGDGHKCAYKRGRFGPESARQRPIGNDPAGTGRPGPSARTGPVQQRVDGVDSTGTGQTIPTRTAGPLREPAFRAGPFYLGQPTCTEVVATAEQRRFVRSPASDANRPDESGDPGPVGHGVVRAGKRGISAVAQRSHDTTRRSDLRSG